MLPHSDYVPVAPASIGEQVHVNHDSCSAGVDRKRRLYIKRNEDTIVAYCHNCSQAGVYHIHGGSVRPLATLKKLYQKKDELLYVKDVHFPTDSEWDVHKWPIKAWQWLKQYNITTSIASQHKICYSPSMGRVILPVFDDKGVLLFWQGRSLDPLIVPKYIAVSSCKKPYMFLRTSSPCTTWVIVEDILSAIKCSEYVNAVALLGTASTNDLLLYLKKEGADKIYLWFDNDNAGWNGRHKTNKMLSFGYDESQIRNVVQEVQPKEATAAQLIEEFSK